MRIQALPDESAVGFPRVKASSSSARRDEGAGPWAWGQDQPTNLGIPWLTDGMLPGCRLSLHCPEAWGVGSGHPWGAATLALEDAVTGWEEAPGFTCQALSASVSSSVAARSQSS